MWNFLLFTAFVFKYFDPCFDKNNKTFFPLRSYLALMCIESKLILQAYLNTITPPLRKTQT